jgi:multicomponent Na+:H+ antiporter subunit G
VNWLALVTDALVVLGVVVMTIGVYGVFRMPDVYTQLHAASKAVFLGDIVLLTASIGTRDPAIIGRAALVAVFLILTTPVAAHVIAQAAYQQRVRMETPGAYDESGYGLADGATPESEVEPAAARAETDL